MALEGWREKGGGTFSWRFSLQDLPGAGRVGVAQVSKRHGRVASQILILIILLTLHKTASCVFPRLTAAKRAHDAREDQANFTSPAPPTMDQSRELAKASGLGRFL